MKWIAMLLAGVLVSTGGMLVADGVPLLVEEKQQKDEQISGREAIAKIRQQYEAGEYDSLFKEMEQAYDEVAGGEKLAGLISFRQGNHEETGLGERALEMKKEFEAKLLAVVSGEETLFADKVRSIATPAVTETEQRAIDRMVQFRDMIPGSGRTADENRLIDLDLEYEYKAMHLVRPAIDGHPVAATREQQFALLMEKADRMRTEALLFQDTDLQRDVMLFTDSLDRQLAKHWDQLDLVALTKANKRAISDPIQKRAVALLLEHQERLAHLISGDTVG
jgi:hypothetical protein